MCKFLLAADRHTNLPVCGNHMATELEALHLINIFDGVVLQRSKSGNVFNVTTLTDLGEKTVSAGPEGEAVFSHQGQRDTSILTAAAGFYRNNFHQAAD